MTKFDCFFFALPLLYQVHPNEEVLLNTTALEDTNQCDGFPSFHIPVPHDEEGAPKVSKFNVELAERNCQVHLLTPIVVFYALHSPVQM